MSIRKNPQTIKQNIKEFNNEMDDVNEAFKEANI